MYSNGHSFPYNESEWGSGLSKKKKGKENVQSTHTSLVVQQSLETDPNLSYSHIIFSYTVALVSFTMLHCDWTSNRPRLVTLR